MEFDKSYLKTDVIIALDEAVECLMENYPGLDFTISRTDNDIRFNIHDKDVFVTSEFQLLVYKEIPETIFWPKRILNIVFMYDKKYP